MNRLCPDCGYVMAWDYWADEWMCVYGQDPYHKKEEMKKDEWNEPRKSGFEDDPLPVQCVHPQHNPPSHMVIPKGKIYRHICPGCGYEAVLRPPQIFMKHDSPRS